MTAKECARLYELMEPGEKLAAICVSRINGRRRTVLLLYGPGGTPRVVHDPDEQDSQAAAS